jgi:hypothetical protein
MAFQLLNTVSASWPLEAAEKLLGILFVKGHDFTRADKVNKSTGCSP